MAFIMHSKQIDSICGPCKYIYIEVLKISLKTHLKPLKRYAYKKLSIILVWKLYMYCFL